VLGLGLLYFLAADLSLRLSLIERNVTPLWPPTGIALVALLVFGRRFWPGIALGALAVNLPISETWWAAAVTAAGNTLAPLAAAEFLRRTGFRPELDRLRDALMIVLAALGGMTISASIGAGTLVVSGTIASGGFPSAWAVWWTGDALGVLVVAPFLLSVGYARAGALSTGWRRAEFAALMLAIVAACFLVVHSTRPMLFLVLPLLGVAAWRFQLIGAAPGALVAAGLAAWSASQEIGPFSSGPLFERMITLQAFNATVAVTSFMFASLVSERLRQREALAHAAAGLEERVQERTAELHQRERQLAQAEQLAHVGGWEWLVAEDRVRWSDELYRIHGHPPQSFPVSFERAVSQILEDDLPPIRKNIEAALAAGRSHALPDIEYRITRADGEQRVVVGKARLECEPGGAPERMVGTVQDVTETRQAEREHRIAETLQRSLLPERLPDIPGVELAARYVPATSEVEVGGDWYDVMTLPNGHVAVAIGDVAGHGLRAASTMGQLRMAVRAYALEEPSPSAVLHRANRLLEQLDLAEMATIVHLTFDPDSGAVHLANAGHPPPLLIHADGAVELLEAGTAPPLGAVVHGRDIPASEHHLEPGAALLLYTDGLIERRGVSLSDGLDRLRAAAAGGPDDLGALCDHLLDVLVDEDVGDDVALVVLRPVLLGATLRLTVPAEPETLPPLRHTVRRWLREVGVGGEAGEDLVLACGEACANVIQHAYGVRGGEIEIELVRDGDEVRATVRDRGSWRAPASGDGGHGLDLMRATMAEVDVRRDEDGTVVRMRRDVS
jgi:integral membrane sensor domain MASE1/anti-sigma regulatory factor (Ser/Thr protein kinase)